jgi:N-dimethylarginine dimethylaminohydrolase
MRVLMCPPDHYDVAYEINPWMHVAQSPNRGLAKRQWEALYTLLGVRVALDVELIAPHAGLPDMVFTANAGLADGKRYLPSRFRHTQRQGETAYFERWFSTHGYQVDAIPAQISGTHEGEGDSFFWRDILICGCGRRSDMALHCAVGGMLGRDVVALNLIDPRWYHLDTCLLPLSSDLIAYYPGAFDADSILAIERLRCDKIIIGEQDALNFGANAVVAGKHVVLHSGCGGLEASLRDHGFRVHATDLSEFIKAGGAAKCLTLLLDHPPA